MLFYIKYFWGREKMAFILGKVHQADVQNLDFFFRCTQVLT